MVFTWLYIYMVFIWFIYGFIMFFFSGVYMVFIWFLYGFIWLYIFEWCLYGL